jgi:hypothetical protein
MATSAAHEVTPQSQDVRLCLDCNYSLIGLPTNRCPECGREFNLENPKSFNSERPLRWIDRKLLKPIGWPTFTTIALICCGYLYLGIYPAMYFLWFVPFVLALVPLFLVALMLAVRDLLRNCLIPSPDFLRDSRQRERRALAIVGISLLLVLFHVPLRIVFFLAKPELDRVAQGINDGSISQPIKSHRAGPIVISDTAYSDDDQHFFYIHGFGGGGFVYCRTPGKYLHYNSGADGHLWSNWYWWIND